MAGKRNAVDRVIDDLLADRVQLTAKITHINETISRLQAAKTAKPSTRAKKGPAPTLVKEG